MQFLRTPVNASGMRNATCIARVAWPARGSPSCATRVRGRRRNRGTLNRRCATPASRAEILDIPDGPTSTAGSIASPPSYDVLAAAGGDGTVSSVAAAVARAGKTLAVIPTGTLNHFARDAGIPTELDQAIAVLRHRPRARLRRRLRQRPLLSQQRQPRQLSADGARARRGSSSSGRSRRWRPRSPSRRTWWRLRSSRRASPIDGRRSDPPQSRSSSSATAATCCPGFVAGQARRASPTASCRSTSRRRRDASARCRCRFARWPAGSSATSSSKRSAPNEITIALRHRRIETGIDGEVRVLESPLDFAVQAAARCASWCRGHEDARPSVGSAFRTHRSRAGRAAAASGGGAEARSRRHLRRLHAAGAPIAVRRRARVPRFARTRGRWSCPAITTSRSTTSSSAWPRR